MGIPHRRLRLIILLVLAVCCSCARTGKESGPVGGGKLVVGILSEPSTLSPLSATSAQAQDIVNLLFLKLLDEEPDFLNFTPRLAKHYEFSRDSLSITFHLRRNVYWHDGERVTATDVRYTWQLQTDPEVAWASRSIKARITDVEAVDDSTVVFRFSHRYPYQLMDANDGVIVPAHLASAIQGKDFRTAAFGRSPVGNGPYRLARWEPGQFIELERNPVYYEDGLPYLDGVVFRIVPDMTTLVTMLKTGEIDCLESLPADALREIRDSYPDVVVRRYSSRSMEYIAWNLDRDLFADRDVRRALAMAINASEMIETLWAGMARVLDSPVHPILWAHDPDMRALPFDPAAAESLLNASGWTDSDGDGVLDKNGRPFEFSMVTNRGVQRRVDTVTMVQAYLGRVGVKVDAQVLEWNAFIQRVISGEFDSCVLGWKTPTRVDLSSFWLSTATPPNGFNASRYRNPEVDGLIERARDTLDPARARELWSQCQRLIYADQPIFFFAVPYEVVGVRKRFCNVHPNAIGFFVNVREWYIGDCP